MVLWVQQLLKKMSCLKKFVMLKNIQILKWQLKVFLKNYLMDLDFYVQHYMIMFQVQMIFMFLLLKLDDLVYVQEILLQVKFENQKKVKNILHY